MGLIYTPGIYTILYLLYMIEALDTLYELKKFGCVEVVRRADAKKVLKRLGIFKLLKINYLSFCCF